VATGDLTDVSAVKNWRQGSATSVNDSEIAVLITAVSADIRRFTNRDYGLGATTYSEIRDGSGGSELFLADGPAASVVSLAVNTTPIPAQTADGQPGYYLVNDGEVLALWGWRFSKGRKNVRVSYTANAGLPADIVQACNEIVVSSLLRGARGPDMRVQTTAPGGAQSFVFSTDDLPAWAKSVLQGHMRVAPA
jgi:hypothetical protein